MFILSLSIKFNKSQLFILIVVYNFQLLIFQFNMVKKEKTKIQQPKIIPKTKKVHKQTTDIEIVQGQRQYQQKPLLDFDSYRQLKNKKYSKFKKETLKNIHLDKFQIKSAVQNLLQFDRKIESNDIFQEQGFVYVEIVLGKVPQEYSIRPVQIPLPVPIYSENYNSKLAILVSDPQRAYKDKIQDLKLSTIAKVIGYQKLKKKYKNLKDKRSLIYTYDLFFCDWKIYNLLRKPLGKLFYQRKKIPYPIDCQSVPQWKKKEFEDNYQAYLNDLNNYTYFIMGNGPVYTVKIARTSMTTRDIVKNVIHGIYNTIPHLLSKQVNLQNIRQISVKTEKSPSLPIFNQLTTQEIVAYKS